MHIFLKASIPWLRSDKPENLKVFDGVENWNTGQFRKLSCIIAFLTSFVGVANEGARLLSIMF